MRHTIRPPMTAEEFISWAEGQPRRHELVAGEIITMEAERAPHVVLKAEVLVALRTGLAAAGAPCQAWADGMAVKIDDSTVYEPDAMVTCGEPYGPETVWMVQPVIIVEVLSPSTQGRDAGAKLEDYFRLPSLRHYLLFKTERPAVIHHDRHADGMIETRILTGGILQLEPPGIEIDIDAIYGAPAMQAIGGPNGSR